MKNQARARTASAGTYRGLKWDEKENRIRHVFVLNLILSLSDATGTYVNVSTTKYYTM